MNKCVQGVELTMNTKARVLAACWQLHKWDLAEHLLSLETHFGLPEVLKALKILGNCCLLNVIDLVSA